MTKYLLHGGATSINSKDNDFFFKQFTSLVNKDQVNILMSYFARKKSDWTRLFERDKDKISKQAENKTSYYVVKDVEDLFNKIKKYDVLYVAGGEPELIEPLYSKLSDLNKAMEGINDWDKDYLAQRNCKLVGESVEVKDETVLELLGLYVFRGH